MSWKLSRVFSYFLRSCVIIHDKFIYKFYKTNPYFFEWSYVVLTKYFLKSDSSRLKKFSYFISTPIKKKEKNLDPVDWPLSANSI